VHAGDVVKIPYSRHALAVPAAWQTHELTHKLVEVSLGYAERDVRASRMIGRKARRYRYLLPISCKCCCPGGVRTTHGRDRDRSSATSAAVPGGS